MVSDSYYGQMEGLDSFEEQDVGVLKQEEGLVMWTVDGLYDEEGKVLPAGTLRADPPVLTVKDWQDNEATFLLTEGLARQLRSVLGDVDRAYHGVPGRRRLSAAAPDTVRIRRWVEQNKVRTTLLAVLLLYVAVVLAL